MNPMSLMLWNEKLAMSQPRVTKLLYSITAAKTVTDVLKSPSLTAFDAIASQAVIDAFLGTSSEFLVAAFDATAMGADAFAAIVNMSGQCQELVGVRSVCYSGTGGSTKVERFVEDSATLTASTLATECAKGSSGNVALKVDFGNTPDFDALTAGQIEIDILWYPK